MVSVEASNDVYFVNYGEYGYFYDSATNLFVKRTTNVALHLAKYQKDLYPGYDHNNDLFTAASLYGPPPRPMDLAEPEQLAVGRDSVLCLRTLSLRDRNVNDLYTFAAPSSKMYNNDPNIVTDVFPDKDMRLAAQTALGMVMCGNATERVVLFKGDGSNGRSTIARHVQSLVGPARIRVIDNVEKFKEKDLALIARDPTPCTTVVCCNSVALSARPSILRRVVVINFGMVFTEFPKADNEKRMVEDYKYDMGELLGWVACGAMMYLTSGLAFRSLTFVTGSDNIRDTDDRDDSNYSNESDEEAGAANEDLIDPEDDGVTNTIPMRKNITPNNKDNAASRSRVPSKSSISVTNEAGLKKDKKSRESKVDKDKRLPQVRTFMEKFTDKDPEMFVPIMDLHAKYIDFAESNGGHGMSRANFNKQLEELEYVIDNDKTKKICKGIRIRD